MSMESIIAQLEAEWQLQNGFLGRLRRGVFDSDGLTRLITILQTVQIENVDVLERRFISLVWYIPLFMGWQHERVREQGGNISDLDSAINRVVNLLEQILGVP